MKKHILLVDDDADELIIFIEALSRLAVSFNCIWAKSGGQALEELVQAEPVIVFLDLNMPGMDGFETLQAIRELPEKAHVPIVLYSTGLTPQNASKAVRLGATACLKKADSIEELAAQLNELLPVLIENTHKASENKQAAEWPFATGAVSYNHFGMPYHFNGCGRIFFTRQTLLIATSRNTTASSCASLQMPVSWESMICKPCHRLNNFWKRVLCR